MKPPFSIARVIVLTRRYRRRTRPIEDHHPRPDWRTFALASVMLCLRKTTLAASAALILAAPTAQAVGFGDMFNPGRWFGGYDDDRYYDQGPYGAYGPGPYGPPGYGGYGPYGAPGYGAPGYGSPGYGGQAPGYGGGPDYGASAPSTSSSPAPSTSERAKDQEIEALKRRIDQLESRGASPNATQPPQGRGGGGWPAAPAFRPMDQY